jgi:tetratricopeptide (TPR) repeat protein
VRTYDEIIQSGWAAFQRSEYHAALSEFKAAVAMDTTRAQGYDGKGWSYALLDSLEESTEALQVCLERDPDLVDPLVCLAAVYSDLPDYNKAISNAQQALVLEPSFVFQHRASYDWRDIRLILAECYYATAEYASAHSEVMELDPLFDLDPGSERYAELLLKKIEELVSTYGGI